MALAQGILSKGLSFFDYGCGRGADVAFLQRRKFRASGWDPNHRPDAKRDPADVVNLGYVINVIENQAERAATLRAAYELAERVLIVSVRVDRALSTAAEYGDGLLTGAGTFQKLYTQTEFTKYLQEVLGVRPHAVAPGIALVFKSPEPESAYLANLAFTRRLEYRTDLIEEFSKSRVAKRYAKLATELGRLPLPEEFKDYPKLIEAFGSGERVQRLALRYVDHEAFDGSKEQRREDILTYFAMLRFQGIKAPRFNVLPASVQADVKTIWASYAAAREEGDTFLFSIGRPEAVRAAAATSSVGKLLPGDFYVHRSAEDFLPALLRLLIFAAGLVVGDVGYDVVKIALDGRAVSFLSYEGFDDDPHPVLVRSVRVYLPRASYGIRSYAESENPPILHRKDTLVARDYPLHARFRALTEAEEARGLLSAKDIGYRTAWDALLVSQGLMLDGHDLKVM